MVGAAQAFQNDVVSLLSNNYINAQWFKANKYLNE